MDSEVIAALISAIAVVVASVIGTVFVHKNKNKKPKNNFLYANKKEKTRIKNIAKREVESKFFLFKKSFGRKAISKVVLDKEGEIIKSSYSPYLAFGKSFELKFEAYLVPIIDERIKLEEEVLVKYRIPFINELKEKVQLDIDNLIQENWKFVVDYAYENATMHVIHHEKFLLDYKEKELKKLVEKYMAKGPHEYLSGYLDELKKRIDVKVLEIGFTINEEQE